MKKMITLLLTAAIAATAAVSLSACGGNNQSSAQTATTQAATKAETTTAATGATSAAKNSASASQTGNDDSSSNDASSSSYETSPADVYLYAGLGYQDACEKAASDVGETVTVNSASQSYTPEGDEAWIVSFTLSDGTERTYFVSSTFLTLAEEFKPENDDKQDYSIVCQNRETGENFSVICSYADDRYDTVSGYFFLSAGTYDIAVYTYNAGGENTSLCGTGYYDNSNPQGERTPVRVNYYMVTGEVEAEIG